MVVLNKIHSDNSKNISTELLVIGRFKDTNIQKCLSFLNNEDKERILNCVSLDLSNGDFGDYLLVPGDKKVKRIIFFNLGEKKKLTNDKLRAYGAKVYSLINSKKIKSMHLDSKSFLLTTDDKAQSFIEGLV